MDANKCLGHHDIYVAEVVGVEKDGKIVVITVCRHCDQVTFHEKQITTPATRLRLLKDEGKE